MKRPFVVVLPAVFVLLSPLKAQEISPTLTSLFETERAFAKASLAKGIRESFLQFFADDGIVFRPQPVTFKEWAGNNPLAAGVARPTLYWEPMYGEVSASGDLGWDTGPYSLTDNSSEKKPTQYGFFFTVWRRLPDGSWKVALDHGIQASGAEAYFGGKPTTSKWFVKRKQNPGPETNRRALVEKDAMTNRLAQTSGLERVYMSHLSEDARLYRNGMMPRIGKDSALAYLRTIRSSVTMESTKSEVASSGDLGYTYGRYELRASVSAPDHAEKGYYVRVWRKEPDGGWRIVFDITSPQPKE